MVTKRVFGCNKQWIEWKGPWLISRDECLWAPFWICLLFKYLLFRLRVVFSVLIFIYFYDYCKYYIGINFESECLLTKCVRVKFMANRNNTIDFFAIKAKTLLYMSSSNNFIKKDRIYRIFKASFHSIVRRK